jgi:hypothetical protein
MTPNLRRLNDRERYWGLTWPAWIGCAAGGALLYVSIRVSPLGTRATITCVVLLLAFAGMVVAGVSGQALSPSRQLRAVLAHRFSPRRYRLSSNLGSGGLVVLDREPKLDAPVLDAGMEASC